MQPQQCVVSVCFQVEKETKGRREDHKFWKMLFRTGDSSSPKRQLTELKELFPAPEHRVLVLTTTTFTVQTVDDIPAICFPVEDNDW